MQNESLFGGGAGANAALTDAMQAAQETGKPSSIATSYASASATMSSGASAATVKSALSKDGYTGQTIQDQLGSSRPSSAASSGCSTPSR